MLSFKLLAKLPNFVHILLICMQGLIPSSILDNSLEDLVRFLYRRSSDTNFRPSHLAILHLGRDAVTMAEKQLFELLDAVQPRRCVTKHMNHIRHE